MTEYLTDEQITERAEENFKFSPVNYAAALDMIAVYKAYIEILKRQLSFVKNATLTNLLNVLPEYRTFEKVVNEKLTLENAYVEHFAPEVHQVYDEKTENGIEYFERIAKREEREEEGVENLLNDKTKWFEDFIHDEIMNETTELCRALIKLERGL